jgi:glycosyltransferase involved in cell wall biosynthesis
LYKQSDFIVSLTLNAKNELIKKYKINSSIISIIPTCANRELFKIISHHERLLIRKQLGFEENDLIIIHTGTTQNRYDFNKEVKVFKFLKERIERLKFLIVTKDSREIIQKVFDKENIGKSNFKIISSSLPEMYKYLNIADFSIFFIPPTYAKKAMAPTKFAENVACYLPSITNRGVGDMEFYLDRYKVGKLVDLENIDYAEILDFVNNRETYIDKKDFDELFNSYFDKKIAVEKYNNIYKRIVSEE